MSKFTVIHEINCDAPTFWKTFFDKTFNTRLYSEALGFPRFEIVEQREDDRQLVRRASGTPKVNLPGPVAKVLGPNMDYTEDGTFDKAAGVWRWALKVMAMPDKLKQEGALRVEALGEGRVRRTADLLVEAKVFGIGGLIESSAEKQLRDGWDKSAVFMNSFLKEQK